ncbi:MAG: RNA polymerase sigma factor RpoD/SigA [Bacteroidales bacterium]|nr:RNA polymerase sigma factor RpoD/SigA [Bacteroidales bacterium]
MKAFKIRQIITLRGDGSIDFYFQDVSKTKTLTIEEEIELARRIRQGDEEALKELVLANLRFVISVAKQYQNQGLSLADLINEGNIGLIKAAKRFDETRGFKFISYAVWWIRQSIMHAIADYSNIVKIPSNKINEIRKVYNAKIYLEQKLEREPSLAEIAEFMGVSEEDVLIYLMMNNRHVYLSNRVKDDEDYTVEDTIQSEENLEENIFYRPSLKYEVNRILNTLSPRERDVIKLYFGIDTDHPHSLDEIGSKLNITRERIRQIKEKALKRLRHSSKNKVLKSYLGN